MSYDNKPAKIIGHVKQHFMLKKGSLDGGHPRKGELAQKGF